MKQLIFINFLLSVIAAILPIVHGGVTTTLTKIVGVTTATDSASHQVKASQNKDLDTAQTLIGIGYSDYLYGHHYYPHFDVGFGNYGHHHHHHHGHHHHY